MTSCVSSGSSLPDSVVEPKRSQSIYRDLAPLGDLLWGRRYCGGGLSWRSAITSSSPIARHLSAIAQHDAEVSGPGPLSSGACPRKMLCGAKNGSKPSWQGWFKVSARTVAKYMRVRHNRGPSPGWREFPKRHAPDIWACDFFRVRTILFQTLHVFFVVRHANRQILHAEVTRHPTADWAAQQIVESCGWDRAPPRFLIHDRDSRYGASFDRRMRHLGIRQVRTPFRSPRANAVAGPVLPPGTRQIEIRGATVQQAVNVASFDRQMDHGYSKKGKRCIAPLIPHPDPWTDHVDGQRVARAVRSTYRVQSWMTGKLLHRDWPSWRLSPSSRRHRDVNKLTKAYDLAAVF
jgi:hypothetical protein